MFPQASSKPDGEIWKSWRSLFFNYIVISVGTQEYTEYRQVSKLPLELAVVFLLSQFKAADSETTRAVGTVTHAARDRGTSNVGIGPIGLVINGNSPVGSGRGTDSLMALQCLHGLKWGNGFAPIWTLKLDSSAHKNHVVSCTQKQKVTYPILSQLTNSCLEEPVFFHGP